MSQDDKIHNPVEQYMEYIMNQDKPDKPPETTTEPARHLEVKGFNQAADSSGSRDEALKVADAIKQSIDIKTGQERDTLQKENPEDISRTTIFNIQRHSIGLILALTAAVAVYAAGFSLISFLLPSLARATGIELNVIGPIAGISMLIITAIGVALLPAVGRSYNFNRLVLTESSLIHSLSFGLVNKKVYEIPLTDIEDVSVQNTDMLSSAFSYGTINIKTVEDQNDLKFKYAPNPSAYAKAIQDSRLEYLADHRLSFL